MDTAEVLPIGVLYSATNTIAFDYNGDVSGAVAFNPLVVNFLQDYLGDDLGSQVGTLPTEVNFNENFTGQFTVPSDPEQYLDGDITLDPSLLNGLFEQITPEVVNEIFYELDLTVPPQLIEIIESPDFTLDNTVAFFDNLFDLELSGTGNLTSPTGTTPFNFNFDETTNSIVINGFDPLVASGSVNGPSTITATGTFTVDMMLSEFIEAAEFLEIDLPLDLAAFIAVSQTLGNNELPVTSGNFNLGLNTTPVSDPLLGSTDVVSEAIATSLTPVLV